MSLLPLKLVVLAALIHATWNLLSKRAASAGPAFVFAYNLVACVVSSLISHLRDAADAAIRRAAVWWRCCEIVSPPSILPTLEIDRIALFRQDNAASRFRISGTGDLRASA
jgi:hypothetical protein